MQDYALLEAALETQRLRALNRKLIIGIIVLLVGGTLGYVANMIALHACK